MEARLAAEGRESHCERPAGYRGHVGRGGVHVGQEDLPMEAARRICHSPCGWEFRHITSSNCERPTRTSADYIAVGPIFATAPKRIPIRWLDWTFCGGARQLTRKPLVAIGGITVESASDLRAGADSIAVIRDLAAAADRRRERASIWRLRAEAPLRALLNDAARHRMAQQTQTIAAAPQLAAGAGKGPWPFRFDNDRWRLDDRVRNLHRFCRHRPPGARAPVCYSSIGW